jgi:hypothetical protein
MTQPQFHTLIDKTIIAEHESALITATRSASKDAAILAASSVLQNMM